MSKCWYCNEELTTANYCDEHIGICTKCYCSMFQVSNEFVKGLMDKIADLEAKLEDCHKQIDRLAGLLNFEKATSKNIAELREKEREEWKAKLAEQQECSLKASAKHNLEMQNAQICVKELEEKLADKDKELEKEYNDGFIWEGKARDAWDEIEKLKQQLVEKDEEIEKLQNNWNKLKNWANCDGFIHLTSVRQLFIQKMETMEIGEYD